MRTALLLTLLAAASVAHAEPMITAGRRDVPRHAEDPLAVRSLNPAFDTFPDSSLVDFSFLLDAPAGKHGFTEQRNDGRFYFSESGARARFWGMTIAADHVGNIDKARISEVVDVLARGGCNLIRLHETDNRGAEKYNLVRRNLIDEAYPNNDNSREFDAEYRDRIDWWIHEAQQKGVYTYLVLRGFRTFRAGDGVAAADELDRSAKPYAMFDERMIELQKEFATEWLFTHVNPYTGIPNGLNPAVACVEIENEDSLFFSAAKWRTLVEPYRSNFHNKWNEWLLAEYKTTDALREAWGDVLGENESLESKTVELPDLALRGLDTLSAETKEPFREPARQRDGVRFGMSIQKEYLATMRDHLRERGARMPLTAVVNGDIPSDTWTTVQELGITAENAYLDHPGFQAGAQWTGRQFFSNKNYLKETGSWSLAAHMARFRWEGAATVVREWAQCWPNEYRVTSFIDVAAQALLQDYDLMSQFAYYTWGSNSTIAPFAVQADPTRWGLNGYAALMYLRRELDIDPAPIALAFNDEDLAVWASSHRPLHELAWTSRTFNSNPDHPVETPWGAIVTVASGRSGIGTYDGRNLVLYDAQYKARAGKEDEEKRKGILMTSGYDHPWIYQTEPWLTSQVQEAGYRPLIYSEDDVHCGGFHDLSRNVVVLGNVEEDAVVAVTRDFLESIKMGQPAFNSNGIKSADILALGGAIRRSTSEGTLIIERETFAAIAGEFELGTTYSSGLVDVEFASPVATLVAASLDGKPLTTSRRYAIKMATVARNRSQQLEPVANETAPEQTRYALMANGEVPVQTEGVPSETPTRVSLSGNPLLEVYMQNGTWEIVVDRDAGTIDIACDTPNIRFKLGESMNAADATITKFYVEHSPAAVEQRGPDFIYPGFAKYVRIATALDK